MIFQGWLCEGCNARFGDEAKAREHESACTVKTERERKDAEAKAKRAAEEARLQPIADQIRALYAAESDKPLGAPTFGGYDDSPREMLAKMVGYCGHCGSEDCGGYCWD